MFHVSQCVCFSRLSLFFLFHLLPTLGLIVFVQCSPVAPKVCSRLSFGLSFAVRRSLFAICRSHSLFAFAVRIHRSSFAFADHRSLIIFSIILSFNICVRSSIGVYLLYSRSCFAPPLFSRSSNTTILLLFAGFVAFAMFDVSVFPIFSRLGCFCKDFRVGYSLPISIWCYAIFISYLYNNSY